MITESPMNIHPWNALIPDMAEAFLQLAYTSIERTDTKLDGPSTTDPAKTVNMAASGAFTIHFRSRRLS